MKIKEIEMIDPLDFCENCGEEVYPRSLYCLTFKSTRQSVVLCGECLRELMVCILSKTGTL